MRRLMRFPRLAARSSRQLGRPAPAFATAPSNKLLARSLVHANRVGALPARAFSTGKKTIPFLLGDIGEGIAEVEMLQWFVQEGDEVMEFDNVCEVQSDKATVEISSRYNGKIVKIYDGVGSMVQVGSPLLDIEVDDADSGGDDAAGEGGASGAPPAVAEAPLGASSLAAAAVGGGVKKEVLTTPAVRKLGKENKLDLSVVPATGPQGRLLKSDVLNYLKGGPPAVPPAVPAAVPASRAPVELPAPPAPAAQAPAPPLAAKPLPSLGLSSETPESRTVAISGIDRLMVQSMNASLKIPHFVYSEEVELDELAEARQQLNKLAEPYGLKLSYLPLLLKAMSMAIADYPVLNSSLSADESSLTFHGRHNIGIAMDTPRGLLVPVVKDVQAKSVFEVAAALRELQQLGAANKLGEQHLTGGTISLSNMGSIGGTYLKPVILAPQTAIVALGRIQTLPRQQAHGSVGLSKVMVANWAGDHRVIDGATMGRFVNTWKALLENPTNMLAHLK